MTGMPQDFDDAAANLIAVPLVPLQRRMWMTNRARPGDRTLNGAFCLALCGPFDTRILTDSLNELVARHEILRGTCRELDGTPMLVIAPRLSVSIPVVGVDNLPEAAREAQVKRLCAAEARSSFDLERGPLIRLGLIRLEDERHVMTLTLHHIICDGWSIRLLIEELVQAYVARVRGQPSPLAPLKIQFADYVSWLEEHLEGPQIAGGLAYWKRKLEGYRPLEVAPDVALPSRCSPDAEIVAHNLPEAVVNGLKRFSNAQGGTMFITTLAAFFALLRHETGRDDVAVGSPVAGRNRIETEKIVGPLLNNVLLRTQIVGDPTFRELESNVREAVLEAFSNQDVPLDMVADALAWSAQGAEAVGAQATPFYGINFMCYRAFAGGQGFKHDLAGTEIRTLPSPSQGALYDLNLFIVERESGWRLALEYRTSLYSAERAKQLLDAYLRILGRIAETPEIALSRLVPKEHPTAQATASIGAADDGESDIYTRAAASAAPHGDQGNATAGAEEASVLPASLSQQRFWLLHNAAPNATTFNVPAALRIIGGLRAETLSDSLARLIERHETLRTTFDEEDGRLIQVIAPRLVIPLAWTSLAEVTAAEREQALHEQLLAEAHVAFDLVCGPLVRAHVFHLGKSDHALLITLHHAVSDGQSVAILQRELWSIYEAREAGHEPELPAVNLQYGDFAVWQQDWLRTPEAAVQLAYWRRKLQSPLPITDFPLDQPLNDLRPSRAGTQTVRLPPELTARLKGLGQSENATMFMVTSAAFAILLARASGQEDIIFGCPIANRNADTEEIIGPFSGPLALRIDMSGNPTLREVLQRTRDAIVEALAHGDLPFERLYEELRVRSVSGRSPLFQFYFSYQSAFLQQQQVKSLTVTPIPDPDVATPYELQLLVVERADGVAAKLTHSLDLLTAPSAQAILADYLRVLTLMCDAPGVALAVVPTRQAADRSQPKPQTRVASYVAPTTAQESKLIGIWQPLLDVERVGVDDDFFELGGQSMMAARLIGEVEKAFDVKIDLSELAALRTIRQLAERVTNPFPGRWGKIVALQPNGKMPPLFCVHGTDNILYFLDLAKVLPKNQPVYGLAAPQVGLTLSTSSIEEIAAYYVREIQAVEPNGPYNLCGYSAGALIAFEMATILRREGKEVARLILIDTSNPLYYQHLTFNQRIYFWTTRLTERYAGRLSFQHWSALFRGLRRRAAKLNWLRNPQPAAAPKTTVEAIQHNLAALEALARSYRPGPFDGEIVVFRSRQSPEFDINPTMGWDQLAGKGVRVLRVEGDHLTMMRTPYVEHLARLVFPAC